MDKFWFKWKVTEEWPLTMSGLKRIMDSSDGKTKLLQICKRAFTPENSRRNRDMYEHVIKGLEKKHVAGPADLYGLVNAIKAEQDL